MWTIGRNSSVGRAGIEYILGDGFSAPIHMYRGGHGVSYTISTKSFLGSKHPKRGVNHLPFSSAESLASNLCHYDRL